MIRRRNMNIGEVLNNSKVQGIISIAAAVVMYFTPDEVDYLIEGLLGMFGIAKLTLKEKDK